MFPEYVEKFNQRQLSEQPASEQVSPVPPHDEDSSRPLSDKLDTSMQEDLKRVEALKEARKNKKQSFPTWMLLLLFSIFGVVMALPLLQPW